MNRSRGCSVLLSSVRGVTEVNLTRIQGIALTPLCVEGGIEDKPKPLPIINSINENGNGRGACYAY